MYHPYNQLNQENSVSQALFGIHGKLKYMENNLKVI